MSIEIMNRVWKYSKQGGSQLLLLLALADNANDGGFCWPGQEYLAKKIRMSKKSIPRLTKKLQAGGELFINDRSDQGKSTQYVVLTEIPWAEFAKTLQTNFHYNKNEILKIRDWFDKVVIGLSVGVDKLGGPQDRGGGVDIAMGRGVDITMGTEPSLTVSEPSPPFADAKSAILTSGEPDNVSVTPEDTASFVSIFGSDNNIISEIRDILIAMSADGIVDHRAYKEQPDRSFFHWVDNGLPVKNIPLGLAKKYGYKSPKISGQPENVLVDKQTQSAFGPHPEVLATYAADVARSAARSLDEQIMEADSFSNVSVDEQEYAADLVRLEVTALDIEIMQESNAPMFPGSPELGQEITINQKFNADPLTDVFGPNPRQAEIDAHKEKPKPSRDEWLLHALGADVEPEIRRQIALMRDEGWKVRDEQVEFAIAQFSAITGFVLPTTKAARKLWEHGIREHLAESHFEGRLGELYKKVWEDKKEAVREGKLTLAHPKSFTTLMYAIINTERGPLNRPSRGQLLDLMVADNLIELKEVGEAVGFFYVDTGELVGDDIPQKYVERYYK